MLPIKPILYALFFVYLVEDPVGVLKTKKGENSLSLLTSCIAAVKMTTS